MLLDVAKEDKPGDQNVFPYEVNLQRVRKAFVWLAKNNPLYEHIDYEPLMKHITEQNAKATKKKKRNKQPSEEGDVTESFVIHDAVDTFQKRMIKRLEEKMGGALRTTSKRALEDVDCKAFPVCFPFGGPGIFAKDYLYSSACEYINARLASVNPTFASDPQYTAWALQVYEDEILDRSTYFATKEKGTIVANEVAAGLTAAKAQKLFWPVACKIRGSDAYFYSHRVETENMCSMLGPCTWMVTLGPKEKEWVDQAVALIDAEIVGKVPFLSENERQAEIERQLAGLDICVERELQELENLGHGEVPAKKLPETTRFMSKKMKRFVRATVDHFEQRVRAFRAWVFENPDVMGEVTDMLIRIEFQSRGYPHAHILVWTRGTPNINTEEGAQRAMNEFIDAHVRTDKGDDEEELFTDLQLHMHTFTCKKAWHCKCRFDYPRPITDRARRSKKSDGMRTARWYVAFCLCGERDGKKDCWLQGRIVCSGRKMRSGSDFLCIWLF